jgi:hypothetical protein
MRTPVVNTGKETCDNLSNIGVSAESEVPPEQERQWKNTGKRIPRQL